MYEKMLDRINHELKLGNEVAFATLMEVKGSSPGKQGATICYFKDKSTMGTVGGGILEYEIINKCRECLDSKEDSLFEHKLIKSSEDTPMQCGGSVKGYIKVFKPRPRLLIVGGGHIGHSIYNVSRALDFYTIVVDDREEFANRDRFKDSEEVYHGEISKILNDIRIDENTYVVIATRGYEKDLEALREIINKGVNEELLNQVYAPIGLNISSNEVDEIAFGIIAELLLVKNKGDLSHRKNKNLRLDK